MILHHLTPSDTRFYCTIAHSFISSHAERFDSNTVADRASEENVGPFVDADDAFEYFQRDRESQYEMHPKYGRYVWDLADQWYQKWSIALSLDQMNHSQECLDHFAVRYCLCPDDCAILQRLYQFMLRHDKASTIPTLFESSYRHILPFYSPHWFADKQACAPYNKDTAPSHIARFVPPYRPSRTAVPERWDLVFLKGLTVDHLLHLDMDLGLLTSVEFVYGITCHRSHDQQSRLVMVMKKALFGSLEQSIAEELPDSYAKPRSIALSIAKNIKNLHWHYIHGNLHPRNILFHYADDVAELTDVTFMRRNDAGHAKHFIRAGRWPYVAPEAVHATELTTAADIYAFGIILWQLISRVTFPADALVDPVLCRVEPIPGILPEWQQLYRDCLQANPANRPSAYTVYRRLERMPEASLDQVTLDYIRQRRKALTEYLTTASLLPGITTARRGDAVWTASVTRLDNRDLQHFPNIVHNL